MPGGDQVMGVEEGGQHLLSRRTEASPIKVTILHHGVGCSINLKVGWHLVESHPNLSWVVDTNIHRLFVNLPLPKEQLA